jgi:hypothetical protein
MKKKAPYLGHITFRTRPEVHRELLDIARHLGLDLSGLLNQMIQESLPSYLRRATTIAEEQAEARSQFELHAFSLPAGHEDLLLLVVDAGRQYPAGEARLTALAETAFRVVGEAKRQGKPAPLAGLLVHSALEELSKEDERKRVEEVLNQLAAASCEGGDDH